MVKTIVEMQLASRQHCTGADRNPTFSIIVWRFKYVSSEMLSNSILSPNFQNFLWEHATRPPVVTCFACKCSLHTIGINYAFIAPIASSVKILVAPF